MPNLFTDKNQCFGCFACSESCPEHTISMKPDAEGFLYPQIDQERCIECGLCTSVCLIDNEVSGNKGNVYALRCKDSDLLFKSSSGGAFSVLANTILEEGGLVCGAAFDQYFHVRHVLGKDIDAMRKSKYVQSDKEGIYTKVKEVLNEGITVLFTGTPCECHAMKKIAGDDKNLITAAIVCRGVASPGLWSEYVKWLSGDDRLEEFCFRDKRVNNNGHTVSYKTGKEERALPMDQEPFSVMYLRCLTLRPSCYTCPYTRRELPFDMTIGDFWGAEKYFRELTDGKGLSLVITRSEAGERLLEKARKEADIYECPEDIELQEALRQSAPKSMLRKLLFKDYDGMKKGEGMSMDLFLKKYGGKKD